MTPRRGFTLMEALAAVITLGLLAAMVVPLLRHLGHLGFPERMQARVLLRTLAARADPAAGSSQAIAGHPGWSLVISPLAAEPEPPPPTGCLPPAGPPHHWLVVGIRDAGGEVLGETVVAVLTPDAPP